METSVNELLTSAGRRLSSDFEFLKQTNPHYAERGIEAENILIEFLNDHLPKRYDASSGIIIDNDNNISSQIDVIVYDAINSPVYRKDKRVMIVPSDNAAIAIEVKSNLSKSELEDAAKKIASVRRLKQSPISNIDQMVTFSEMIITKTIGVVFAYDSTTTLDTLAENLIEINQGLDVREWIDMVVVLGKGTISYVLKQPLREGIAGHFSVITTEKIYPPPYYISVAVSEAGDLTINEFYAHLMSYLTFFRKRSSVDISSLTGRMKRPAKIINSFQFNSKSEISVADKTHLPDNFHFERNYYFYEKKADEYLGCIAFLEWKDGGVVFYSGRIKPSLVMVPYYRACNQKSGHFFPGGGSANDWCSIVLALSPKKFDEITLGDLRSTLDAKGIYVSKECKIPGMPESLKSPKNKGSDENAEK
jgi:hypothetical protein